MIAALIGVGGTILVAVAGSYVRTSQRLTAIETALGLRDTPDAREGRKLQQQRQARHVCAGPHECYYRQPQGSTTNPRIPIYDPSHGGGDSIA
jgi:hypothetical protein